MEKKKILEEVVIIFWLFVIGSVAGYIYEMTLVFIKKGFFENRQGLIYGPIIPVYGIGAIVYYLVLKNINTKNKLKVFLITAILGGITEYICSFIQEKIFGTISWDYSNLLFNINGRTSLLHCCYWGIAGIIYVVYIVPLIKKLKDKINNNAMKVITLMLSIMIIFDIGISYIAANRQTERRNNIEAEGAIDRFLDKYYPDEFMDKIYANKKEV